jgi:hypothetical protein
VVSELLVPKFTNVPQALAEGQFVGAFMHSGAVGDDGQSDSGLAQVVLVGEQAEAYEKAACIDV